MENTNNINNEEVKPKRVYTEAQIRAVKAYHEKHRNSEEFKQRQRVNAKKASASESRDQFFLGLPGSPSLFNDSVAAPVSVADGPSRASLDG